MRMKYPVVLLMTLLLFRFSGLAIGCCEGDPPGNPFCYTCEDGVWVLKDWADCGQDSDCTGKCHGGCYLCTCSDDPSKCTDECHNGCSGGSCVDDDSKCGECGYCFYGNCFTDSSKCSGCCSCAIDHSCYDNEWNCAYKETCEDCNCVEAGLCQTTGGCRDSAQDCSLYDGNGNEIACEILGDEYWNIDGKVEYECDIPKNCGVTGWAGCQWYYECVWKPVTQTCEASIHGDLGMVYTECVDKHGIHY